MDKKTKTKYALKFAKLSYSLEEKRETDILKNAERLILSCLTISVIAFFNFKALSKNGVDIKGNIVFVTILLIVSFISSVFSQRRIPYETMLIGDEFEEYLEKYKDDYNDESDYGGGFYWGGTGSESKKVIVTFLAPFDQCPKDIKDGQPEWVKDFLHHIFEI